MKVGIIILAMFLYGCGKDKVTTQNGQTIDEFTRNYQDQIGTQGIAKKGESVTIYQDVELIVDNNCEYKYASGERIVINQNPKLIKIFSKDIYNLEKGPLPKCSQTKIHKSIVRVPAVKLKELYLKAVTNKCAFIKDFFGEAAKITFCNHAFQGVSTYRSERAGVFKTSFGFQIDSKNYTVVSDSTHLSSGFFWVPYPVTQRTFVNTREVPTHFTKVLTDYYTQEIDERDYDQILVMDYYEGWQL
jgi:hypothetical protein